MAYTTPSSVKTYLDISSSGDDMLLTDLISQATSIINAFTKRNFEAASATRSFDAIADVVGRTLWLDEDLASASGVTVTNGDGTTVASGERVFLPSNEWPKYAIKLLVSSNKDWTYSTDAEDAITVAANKWGYSTGAPGDVVHATRRLTAYLYRQRGKNNDGDRPIIAPDGSVIMPMQLPDDVKSILARYVKRSR